MIDERTFEKIVSRTVGSVLTEHGYELSTAEAFRSRFERATTFVQVTYDASRSHEVSVWLGETTATDEPPFELADALRVTDCEADDISAVELIQTSDPAALERWLGRVANLLETCACQFLRGDSDVFTAARSARSRRAAAYTAGLRHSAVLEAADAAWTDREYGRVHDLLNPIRDSLDEPNLRRLKFAERKL